jgi:hypothetical protein
MTEIVLTQQFCGPPNSGNGGYVSGLMAAHIRGPARAMLRAPPALNTKLRLEKTDHDWKLWAPDGTLVGDARAADPDTLPIPPSPPDLPEAVAAARRFPGLERPFHPICFTCGDMLKEGFGLRVFVGQLDGAPEGFVAGPWACDPAFGDRHGRARPEVVWAALDCPGSVAWVVGGHGGALLGTMTCEILRAPAVGETCVVTAWPLHHHGRKKTSGTALWSAGGDLLARSHQIWIGRPMVAEAA